mmetsp:Transcript_82590/g.130588  ORF Transcript_82590/g.130588 Transcript_82590/m.130588 type:complete len:413 (+) Transcript_82590:43-1281(+)
MMSPESEGDGDFGGLDAYDEGGVPGDRGVGAEHEGDEGEEEPKKLDLDEALRQHAAGYGGGELHDDLNLANDLSNSDFMSPSDSKEFTVKLQKLPGMRLGVECVQFAEELVVQAISEGMIAEEWNLKNPFLAIKEGDVIRQVNSIRGDPKKMLSELRSGLVLTIKAEHCCRQVPTEEEEKHQTVKRTGGALLRLHQRMEMEAQIMDQAFAMAAISRRHERQDLDANVWEAASAWNLESFMFFEEVPFLAAFGYTAKDKLNWEEGKMIPNLTMDLDEHFEQAGCTWYVIKCKLEVPVGDGKAETMTWEAPRRLHHLRMELHDRMKYYMEEKFYARVFGETPFARHMAPRGTTARLKAWLATLASAIKKQEVPPMAAAITLLFLHAPVPLDAGESPKVEPPAVKPPRPSHILAI